MTQSQALDDEGASALVAICAATFAVEAIANAVSELVMPKETFEKWKSGAGRPVKASTRLRETLKVAIADHGLATSLADRWEPLIEVRNAAVHFYAELRPLAVHPSGHTTEAHAISHSRENAQEAVALLRETLVALRDRPRPEGGPLGCRADPPDRRAQRLRATGPAAYSHRCTSSSCRRNRQRSPRGATE